MINTNEIAKEYRLAHWAKVMQERVECGLSIRGFCSQIGISENTYFYWQRRVRESACEQLALRESEVALAAAPAFVEVKLAETPALPEAVPSSPIRVAFRDAEVMLDSAYPPERLAALLRELTRSC